MIEEQGLNGTETGQSGFAVLLFQDIAVIPMLAMLPLLAGEQNVGSWFDAFTVLKEHCIRAERMSFQKNPMIPEKSFWQKKFQKFFYDVSGELRAILRMT